MSDEPRLGIAGRVAKAFLTSQITPLLALAGLLLGLFAVAVTPREEEPQIDVTFANIFVPYPGATAKEVEQLVATPGEQVLSEIQGIDHVYASAMPSQAVFSVQFKVGEPRTEALVRLYNKVMSNQDWFPPNLGVGQPIIKPKGIDDVPIIAGTLWSEEPEIGAHELKQVAHAIEVELKRVPGTRDVYTLGGPDRVVHVKLDPDRLAGYGLGFQDLKRALQAANSSQVASTMVKDNKEIEVQAGSFLTSPAEIGELVVGVHQERLVYLRDVAEVQYGPDQPEQYVWLGTGPAAQAKGIETQGDYFPAVTIAVAKKAGTNAVDIADRVIQRFEQLKGTFVPEGVNATITRNYGETANAKAQKLIKKLIFATSAVVLLVLVTLGWREAVIVGVAVIITLAITLFASWAYGFTLNRVSLFALIFSIGILVDDAIVVVENIHRHMRMGQRTLLEAIPYAADEVGGPTILATFTVIGALLPMAFVTGLMGPYMSPIPINASMGMLISLGIAYVVTPWMTYKFFRRVAEQHTPGESHGQDVVPWVLKLFRLGVTPFLRQKKGRLLRWGLLGVVLVLIGLSLVLAINKSVVLKMLPFDNKSEFQVVVDMPEGTSVERTAQVLDDLSSYLATVPEVSDYQAYAGTHSPINFNGLVRQYYLRESPYQGEIQVNLVDKHHRERKSHKIALAVRGPLDEIGKQYNANVKIVEVPPGPPVQAPIVAEIYGLDYQGQIEVAKRVREIFENTAGIVDIDDSVVHPAKRLVIHVDRQKAARLGVCQETIANVIAGVMGGADVGYLHGENAKYAIPIRMELPVADKADIDDVLALKVKCQSNELVPLSELVEVEETTRQVTYQHKDLLPVVYVTADMAGELDSPLYGMFTIFGKLLQDPLANDQTIDQRLISQPDDPYFYSIKWDGEWQITYETFRDMGIAYAVGLILIYLLIVAQFGSYLVPLIIMAPIPLTIIGVMPGHALLGAQFTATSMIGMIALAGIIVRNSILLVDFINQEVRAGKPFQEAVIRSGAVRSKPIVLTALAAVIGATFILDDPIFSGLAVSLIFGIAVSTLLTLFVIPVVYYAAMYKKLETQVPAGEAQSTE